MFCVWLQRCFVAALMALLVGCGSNLGDSFVDKDPVDQALIRLENNDPDGAISILEEALADDPDDYEVLSILALAVAQKHGLEPLGFALKLAQQGSDGSGSGLTAIMSSLPDATSENIAGIQLAVNYLNDIPSASRSTADTFKLSMFQTALVSLMMKKFDSDLSGKFDPAELANLSDDDAAAILAMLASAAESGANGADGDNTAGAAAKVADIQSAIANQEGETDTERLQNYLGSVAGSGG